MHRVTSAMPRGTARMLRPLSSISASKTFLKPIKTKQDGADILHDPLWNKGMGMDYNERDRLHLRGLLPPRHKSMDNQAHSRSAPDIPTHPQLAHPSQHSVSTHPSGIHSGGPGDEPHPLGGRRRQGRHPEEPLPAGPAQPQRDAVPPGASRQRGGAGPPHLHAHRGARVPAVRRPVPSQPRHVLLARGSRPLLLHVCSTHPQHTRSTSAAHAFEHPWLPSVHPSSIRPGASTGTTTTST